MVLVRMIFVVLAMCLLPCAAFFAPSPSIGVRTRFMSTTTLCSASKVDPESWEAKETKRIQSMSFEKMMEEEVTDTMKSNIAKFIKSLEKEEKK
eukprot:1778368-Rhodomonas_salina.4